LDAAAPDAAVVLAGHARWGDGVFRRLAGEFALVLRKAGGGRIIAATDTLAVRPLFYASVGSRLAVSTDTAALRGFPGISSEPDHDWVVANLIDARHSDDATPYRAIRRLPGGHLLEVGPGGPFLRRWWGPWFPAPASNAPGVIEAFREAFIDSVRSRLRGTRRALLLMSGGYDSTAVAGVAAAVLASGASESLKLVSAVFDGMACNERSRIEACARVLPFALEFVAPGIQALDLSEIGDECIRHDAPAANIQAGIFRAFRRAADAADADLILTGVGGDDVATDWAYQVDWFRSAGLLGLPTAARGLAAIEGVSTAKAFKSALRATLPAPARAIWRRLRTGGRVPPLPMAAEFLTPFARKVARRLLAVPARPKVGYGSHSQEVRWEIRSDPTVQSASAWWARELSTSGAPVTSPWQDRRVIEVVLGAPPDLLPRSFPEGRFKPLLVAALGSYVPPEITAGFWKPVFDDYHERIVRMSVSSLEAGLFGTADWRSEPWIDRDAASCLLRGMASARPPVRRLAEAVLGVETWLRMCVRPSDQAGVQEA
jgi:asparagine synthase (glutamine-hydrolysing)